MHSINASITYLYRKKLGTILLANALLGFAYAQWVRPNGIINGGVTSVAMILERLTGLSVILLANGVTLSLLVLCFLFLGREVFLKSIFSGFCYNMFFALFTMIPWRLSVHILVDFPLAVVCISLGYFGCIASQSSTVGMDVIALILNKKNPKIDVAIAIRVINFIVLGVGLLVYGWQSVALGFVFSLGTTHLLQRLIKRRFDERRNV